MSSFRNKEMPLRQIIVLLKNLKKLGVERVAIGGGEPFVRKDIFKILSECPKCISILSNGILLNDEILEKLKDFEKRKKKVIDIRISLDGLKSHDKMRDYQFQVILDKIQKIRKMGFVTVVNTTISPSLSKNELIDLLNELESRKVDQWNIDIPFNEGNYKKNHLKINTTFILGEFYKLVRHYLKSDYKIRMDIVGLFSSERLKNKEVFYKCDLSEHPCNYQFSSVTINPTGFIQVCPSLHLHFGHMREIYNYRDSKKWINFISKNRISPGCNGCKYIQICGGGCRANSLSFSGKLWGKDKLSCKLMKFLEKKMIKLYPKFIQNQFKKLILNSWKIKDYSLKDKPQIKKLFKSIYPNWGNEDFKKVLYNPKNKKHVSTKIQFIEKIAVGQANIFKIKNSKEIANLGYHIHPNHRKQGIGLRLSQLVINDAKQKGMKILIIRTYKSNLASIALGRKLGFKKANKDFIREKNLSSIKGKNLLLYYKEI
jgi:radical SAM protein with 4Fe4S-binding SPASM domain